jgi:amino acid permease
MGTSILMMKTQIGLGVLSIPLVFDTLGMISGIIILLAITGITTWVRGHRRIEYISSPY